MYVSRCASSAVAAVLRVAFAFRPAEKLLLPTRRRRAAAAVARVDIEDAGRRRKSVVSLRHCQQPESRRRRKGQASPEPTPTPPVARPQRVVAELYVLPAAGTRWR
jgi:hypothetical protein